MCRLYQAIGNEISIERDYSGHAVTRTPGTKRPHQRKRHAFGMRCYAFNVKSAARSKTGQGFKKEEGRAMKISGRPAMTFLLLAVLAGLNRLPLPDTTLAAQGEEERIQTIGKLASEVEFFVGSISGDRPEGSSVILNSKFASALKEHFNSITAENVLKWGPLAPAPDVYDFERADLVVDFAEENGLRIRGHTLVWARINGPPSWLAGEVEGADDPAARLREIIEQHVTTVVSRYRGRIPVWDVVNEPLAVFGTMLDPNSLFTQVLGEEYIDIAFRAARKADPDAILVLNETAVIINEAKLNALLDLAQKHIEQGTPIDAIGLQGQFVGGQPPSREVLKARLEAVAALGLTVEITELGIPMTYYKNQADPPIAQASAFASVFGACLDVPACTGVTLWGVYDAETWIDEFFPWHKPARPLLLDEEFARKPAYEAVLTLFRDGCRSPKNAE